jgi:hypothetical protein
MLLPRGGFPHPLLQLHGGHLQVLLCLALHRLLRLEEILREAGDALDCTPWFLPRGQVPGRPLPPAAQGRVCDPWQAADFMALAGQSNNTGVAAAPRSLPAPRPACRTATAPSTG